MGPANSLHASAYYSEYNEIFDLIWIFHVVSFNCRQPVWQVLAEDKQLFLGDLLGLKT